MYTVRNRFFAHLSIFNNRLVFSPKKFLQTQLEGVQLKIISLVHTKSPYPQFQASAVQTFFRIP